jgi:hypothetical protein
VRLGIAHHLGWAIAVTATDDHRVVDRRRIELIDAGAPIAPVEHEIVGLDDVAAARFVASAREAAVHVTSASLDALVSTVAEPISSMSIRSWPLDFPDDVAVLRRAPHNSRADSVMYLQVLAECAHERGWSVHTYDAGGVERQASAILGARADDVLSAPRALLGPPWNKDHRMALAATVLAG